MNPNAFAFGGLMMSTLLLVVLWSIFWKGLALWHAAKRNEAGWFVAILLVNTVGILEMIYLFGVAKVKGDDLFR
ncbi:MAG: DUF5652 family protein [Candidatus Uhrbacteria bacterium]